MASVPVRNNRPTTDYEAGLLLDVADRLTAGGLMVELKLDRRQITARQPAVTGAPGVGIGLSQVVYLSRRRDAEGEPHSWVIRLDEGFRGEDGSAFEPLADGADVERVVHLMGNILRLDGDRPAPAPTGEPVA